MLFCHPESEATTAKHRGLGKEKGFTGAPGIAFLDAAGDVIVRIPASAHSVAQFRTYEARARQFLAWRAAVAHGDPRAAAALLIAQLEESQVDRKTAETRRAKLPDETADERTRLDALLLDLRIHDDFGGIQNDLAARRELGRRFLAMLAEGHHPSERVTRGFWMVILEHCEASEDIAGYEIGLAGLRANLERTSGGAAWGVEMVAGYERTLERLRGRSDHKD